MDLFDKCWGFTEAKRVQAAGFYPYFIPLSDSEGTQVTVGDHQLIMIGSNNYLGLATHPRVRQAAIEATQRYGASCTGSRFLNGTLELHLELEQRLAEFVGAEAALAFSTGYQTNVGTISALVGRDDFVVTDKDDHASIVDGCRLALGEMRRFRHNDMAHLERVLAGLPEEAGKLVVVDGVFSMGGDIAPLPEIVSLCQKYGARHMVDDAHSIGVLGEGRGTAAHFGLTGQVDLTMGTFSKSLASLGGFIAGAADVIHYIQHHARSLIFSASIPPANAAAALAALEIMQEEPERIARVNQIGEYMRTELRRLGFNVGACETPIVPVVIGDDMHTFITWKALYDAGVYTNAVISPAVPSGSALLRTSYMATHTDEQLDRVLQVFAEVGRTLGLLG
ncbi:MAG: 8-amino-7-oxononanoate synthase [Chloroflexi bacterium]|nr:MAG: 8-amino-7-oxononanoate synthase [Anaerolineaceae bacterium 4572_32.2]RLC78552.1 MAG: 8-amino-7-oxononanoate synthase [Chloroflexota bacterium]RLC84167.1 MAG: 8-amino-7-oxononanoate synthase [Chloroflexota bacterium]HEY71669.1 pyridoxal phosphate-dependent aminotransferase family protein [Thermoflexia bacterium]